MGGGSKTSTQVSEVKLPAWVEQASQQNYNFAQNVANQPYQAYGGQTVAGFSPDQYAAFDYARNNIGAYQGVYDGAIGMAANAGNSTTPYVNTNYGANSVYAPMANGYYQAQNVTPNTTFANYQYSNVAPTMTNADYNAQYVEGPQTNSNYRGYITSLVNPLSYNYNYTPETVQAQSFKDADVSNYMNPYLDQVESYALQNLQAGTQQGLNKIGDQAAASGAFGGSRQGVQEGVLMGDASKRAGELSANIRAQGYDKALQQITADQNRNLQGQVSNQGAGLQNAGYGLQAGLANLNAAMQAQELNRNTDLQLAGLAQRGDLANQQTALQAALANQSAGMDLNRLNQASQFANQQAMLQAALANQAAGMDLNKLDQASQFANQRANLEASLANQSAGMDLNKLDQAAQFSNQQALMQAQLANQQAGMDLNRLSMQGEMANQNATQQDYARQLQAALGMGQLGNEANSAIGTDLARLLTIGGAQQEQEQRYLDDAYSRFSEARDYPKEQLNILMAALGMSPYGRTQTTTSTQNNGTDIGGILGGAGSAAAGMAKLLPILMSSDKTMKTDMQKVGKDKATGLDVYSYRYKGDPKSYPKVVGLMADDIEEKAPEAVKTIGGKKAVAFNPAVPKGRIAKKKGKA